MYYKIAEPNEYVVVTGQGVDNVKIVKKALVLPFQRASTISIAPFDFEITLQAMTVEKLSFCLPAVFTIGPYDEPEALKQYAQLLTGGHETGKLKDRTAASGRTHVQKIVKGIIEGETRVIVSSMTMEEIFNQRDIFKKNVIHSVQSELNQFGLKIYNANVKELQDSPGSEYFTFLSRKAHEGASNQAKIDVANARMLGEIGEAEKRGKTRQEISKIEAATAVLETERKSDKAKADAELKKTTAALNMEINLAEIRAKRGAEGQDAEMQKEVELKRAQMELERRRATDLVKAQIEREATMQKTDASQYTRRAEADAAQYTKKAEADGRIYSEKKIAEANLYKKQLESDGVLYEQEQRAKGMIQMAHAYGELANVLGGPQGLMQYLMLQNGTFEKLAEQNAKAVHGMAPKISQWGGSAFPGGGDGSSAGTGGNAIADIYKSLPPLLSTVHEQTGLAPPNWLGHLSGANGYDQQLVKQQQQQQQQHRAQTNGKN